MQLKLTTNLGSVDAKRIGVDPEKATEGATVNVDSKAAEELIARGWAVDPGRKAPATHRANSAEFSETPGDVLGREADAEIGSDDESDDEPPDFDTMTKDELKTFADAHGIEGVTMAMAKDDMLRAVKRGYRSL